MRGVWRERERGERNRREGVRGRQGGRHTHREGETEEERDCVRVRELVDIRKGIRENQNKFTLIEVNSTSYSPILLTYPIALY